MSLRRSTRLEARREGDPNVSVLSWLLANSGPASTDAIGVLQEHGAIGRTPGHVLEELMYPDEMKGMRKCYLRALYCVSKKAAWEVYDGKIDRRDDELIKATLKKHVPESEGCVFRLRKTVTEQRHYVGISKDRYYDEKVHYRVQDYDKAVTLLNFLELPDTVFGGIGTKITPQQLNGLQNKDQSNDNTKVPDEAGNEALPTATSKPKADQSVTIDYKTTTHIELDAIKNGIVKEIAELDANRKATTIPEEWLQIDGKVAKLKWRYRAILYTTIEHHRYMSREKDKAFNQLIRKIKQQSRLNFEELEEIEALSRRIQDAPCPDLPETAQASSQLQAILSHAHLDMIWPAISKLNRDINFHAIKWSDSQDEEEKANEERTEDSETDEEEKANEEQAEDSETDGKCAHAQDQEEKSNEDQEGKANEEQAEDSETEGSLGVEGRFSAMHSTGYPPKEHTKSRCRKRSGESRRSRSRAKKASRQEGGSRLVRKKAPSRTAVGENSRTCLVDAIMNLLSTRRDGSSVLSALTSAMPDEGDTSIKDVSGVLASHNMQLVSVSGEYIKKGGAPFNLFKEHKCSHILKIKLTDSEGDDINHFVAWDGKTIHDDPYSRIVNETADRRDKTSSTKVFDKLFGDLRWQITNVFCLVGC